VLSLLAAVLPAVLMLLLVPLVSAPRLAIGGGLVLAVMGLLAAPVDVLPLRPLGELVARVRQDAVLALAALPFLLPLVVAALAADAIVGVLLAVVTAVATLMALLTALGAELPLPGLLVALVVLLVQVALIALTDVFLLVLPVMMTLLVVTLLVVTLLLVTLLLVVMTLVLLATVPVAMLVAALGCLLIGGTAVLILPGLTAPLAVFVLVALVPLLVRDASCHDNLGPVVRGRTRESCTRFDRAHHCYQSVSRRRPNAPVAPTA